MEMLKLKLIMGGGAIFVHCTLQYTVHTVVYIMNMSSDVSITIVYFLNNHFLALCSVTCIYVVGDD